MKLYLTILPKVLILLIAGFFVCCTPQARLNRLLKNHPELKEAAIITYTINPYSIDSTIKITDHKALIDSIIDRNTHLSVDEKIELGNKLKPLFDTTTRIYRPIKIGNHNGDTAKVYQDSTGIHLNIFNHGSEAKAAGHIPVIRSCEHTPLRTFFFGLLVGIILMILFVGWLTKGGNA